jgi:hypothetical protein
VNPDTIAATVARPATVRRFQRFHALVAELATRDMDTIAVASFLQCSPTAARKYLNDLLEASVIKPRRSVLRGDSRMRNCYQLTADLWLAQNILRDIHESQCGEAIFTRRNMRTNAASGNQTRHFHIMADDCHARVSASHVAVRRDPLVAALFGDGTQRTGLPA